MVVVNDCSAVLRGTALRRWQGLDPARLLTCRVGYLRRSPALSARVGDCESLQDGIAGVMPGAPRGVRKLSGKALKQHISRCRNAVNPAVKHDLAGEIAVVTARPTHACPSRKPNWPQDPSKAKPQTSRSSRRVGM
jgi:hypothetical protein